MKTRLGLDVGTSSIGWCLVQVDEPVRHGRIIDLGARIFSDGREAKSGESLAVARRDARAMRRRRDRYLRRRTVFLEELIRFGLIRRVRVREPLNVIAIRDREGRAYKAYKGDSNARYDVWRLPDGKWTADVVSMFDAHQAETADRRPHPAAKKVLSLRQNDLIAIERNGGPAEIVRVVKFSTNGQMTLAANNEAGPLKARDALSEAEDPFKYIYASGGALKKLKARQIRIDPLGRVFDPGPRD